MAEDSGYKSRDYMTIILDKGNTGYGFNIRGGIDNCHIGTDTGIFVTSMRPDGAAAKDGRLKKGDRILSVNGTSLARVTHNQAVDAFRKATEKVVLVVEGGAEGTIKDELEEKERLKFKADANENSTVTRVTNSFQPRRTAADQPRRTAADQLLTVLEVGRTYKIHYVAIFAVVVGCSIVMYRRYRPVPRYPTVGWKEWIMNGINKINPWGY